MRRLLQDRKTLYLVLAIVVVIAVIITAVLIKKGKK